MAHDVDLSEMSRDDLVNLEKDVQKALKSYDQRKRTEAMAAAKEAAKEHGFALEELLQDAPSKPKSLPKFANPENPAETWTGRGRKPKWMQEKLASGHTQDEFLIT
ncbi:H-NS family nucleoid-associated regulatory protein [Roseivivax halodurans]|uniref:H-NS histone family protein n=1 Tax=Roseivivax halodurans TaxID=93683 RepID=UPI000A079D65|nr:H-NS histone family protein [Roseivivax halodurans]